MPKVMRTLASGYRRFWLVEIDPLRRVRIFRNDRSPGLTVVGLACKLSKVLHGGRRKLAIVNMVWQANQSSCVGLNNVRFQFAKQGGVGIEILEGTTRFIQH